jgi:DNA-binding response OmpR family regulator
MHSVLVVEDDETLAFALCESLRVEGYAAESVGDGRSALARLASSPAALVLLDLGLGSVSGFDVLRALRATDATTAVVVLSGRDQEVDKVQSFRLGADDYVVKPVGPLELLARIEAILRRTTPRTGVPVSAPAASRFSFGDVEVDVLRRTVFRSGQLVDVRPREFDLLVHLLEMDGRVVSRTTLIQKVWRYAPDIASRTVDQHNNRLRQRLEEDCANPRHILTVRRAGYRVAV